MSWNWVLDHIVFILIAAGGIAQWLNKQREAQQKKAARRDSGTRQPVEDGLDATERTRRIQEEIRRKIAERRAVLERAFEVPTASRSKPVVVPPPMPAARPMPVMVSPEMEALERQRRIAAELAGLQPVEPAGPMSEAKIWSDQARTAAGSGPGRGGLAAALRQREGLRRAIVLGEILGPPPGLR